MSSFTDKWIDDHSAELIEALQAAIRIPGLKTAPLSGAPFGEDIRRSLDNALALAGRLGLKTHDYEGYIGAADYGEGKETLAVLAHLDIVPAGPGWVHAPFGGELDEGFIYGRGTMDDKGPAIAALFALAAVKASGAGMKRRVRVLLGCDEECGMEDLAYYFKQEKEPEMAFTPDGDYPLVHSEKSIVHAIYKKRFASAVTVRAGERSNVVPGVAEALVPLPLNRILPIAEAAMEKSEFSCTMDSRDDGTFIKLTGLGAHASTPESGKNALQALIRLLTLLPLAPQDALAAQEIYDAFGLEYYGETVGLDLRDESGRLTLNLGVIDWNKEGYTLNIDLRCPTSLTSEFIKQKLAAALPGAELFDYDFNPGHFVPEESELVKTLLAIYSEYTGVVDPKPLRIGGGTYARHIKNAVAFGPEVYGAPSLAHMPEERVSAADFLLNAKMTAEAILRLACE